MNRHPIGRQRRRFRRRIVLEHLEDRHLLSFGNVFVTGHDILLHAGQNGYDSKVLDFMRGAGTNGEIPPSEYSIAVLGSGAGSWSFSDESNGRSQHEKPGYEKTSYFDTNDLTRAPSRWNEVLSHDGLIVLSHTSCGGCDLTTAGVNEINANAAQIVDAVSAGMDLWMGSQGEQGDRSDYYNLLDALVPVENAEFSGSSGFVATDLGVEFGLTDAMINGHATHNAFQPNDGLVVLETNGDQIISAFLGGFTVGGRVWEDANRNGVQDPNESNLAGVHLRLLDESGQAKLDAVSDMDGIYQFFVPIPGTYRVEVAPTDIVLSPHNVGDDALDNDFDPATGQTEGFEVSFAGESDFEFDAGLYGDGGPAAIASTVWNDVNLDGVQNDDEPTLSGVTVRLLDSQGTVLATDATDETGEYRFEDLAAGLYQVEIDSTNDFAFTESDTGADDAVDSDIDPETSRTSVFSLVAGQVDDSRDAGLIRVYSIFGRAWEDTDGNGLQDAAESGLADLTIQLQDVNGFVVTSTTSGENGDYQLRALPGTYAVAVIPHGTLSLTNPNQGDDPTIDSDIDPETKRSALLTIIDSHVQNLDIGLSYVQLEITEFLAINQTGLANRFGETSDWIEITNTGNIPADLKGWHLTDRQPRLTKFQFEYSHFLAPGESVVVFASGYNDFGDEIHASFKLASSGEYLALVAPDGTTIASEFAPSYGQQVPDVSYGRNEAGEGVFFTTPTPGTPNGQGVSQVPFTLVITEVMAINHGTLADEDGDFADWIEVYNAGETSVLLEGWYLTDAEWNLQRWEFPKITLPAGEFIVVFASGNNRRDRDSELHTNFKLSGFGETVALVDPDGVTVVSEYDLDGQQSDVSYGLSPDFRTQRFFTTPTPGERNTEQHLNVAFSHPHAYYDQSFDLELTTETVGAEIWYTTDGSEPSSNNGTLYTSPLVVDSTTLMRARATLPAEAGEVFTQSFLFVEDIITEDGAGLPTTWGFIPDYEMDPEVVEDPVYAGRLADGFADLPTISIAADESDLFSITNGIYANPTMFQGDARTRMASFEWIDNRGGPGLQLNAGLSIETTVGDLGPPESPKLPLRLDFKERYGSVSSNVAIFAEDRGIDALVLHAGYEDSWIHKDGDLRAQAQYTRDQWLRDSQRAMGQPALESQFVHVFINSVYWGVYNAIEAPTAHVAAGHMGGTAEEYDVLNGAGLIAGNTDAWDSLIQLTSGDLTDPNQYDLIQQYLDVENLADYIVLENYAGNTAAAAEGWYAVRRRLDGSGFRFWAWDGETIFGDTEAALPPATAGTPRSLFDQLIVNEEFQQLFADRQQLHLTNGGALDADPVAQRLTQYELVDALVAESARWGDYRRDAHEFETGPFELMTDEQWLDESLRIRAEFIPGRSEAVIEAFRENDAYPSIDAPSFSQHGGVIANGTEVSITAPAGTIFYTLDGSDVRLPGGGISPAAQSYVSAIPINFSTQVITRALSGDTWSAATEATFLVDVPPELIITEIMYHPPGPSAEEVGAGFLDDDDFEFIELHNQGSQTLALSGIKFTDGIDFEFAGSDVLSLAPDEFVVVVSNQAAFEFRYGAGINVAGQYAGRLNNGGETVVVSGGFDEHITAVYFDDIFELTDGGGFSLVLDERSNSFDDDDFEDYATVSAFRGGSPGDGDPRIEPESIVINEVLPFSMESLDWVELHNTTTEQIDIGGWFLSDNPDNLRRYEFPPDTVILGGGHLVVDQSEFGFGFAREGDGIFLSSGKDGVLAGYRESESYERAEDDVTYGRVNSSSGESEFLRLTRPTRGSENAGPRVGPMVINEIMYHPPTTGNEYIELVNISIDSVPLGGWRLTGVDFQFPNDVVVPGGGYLLVVDDDPAAFRERLSIPAETIVLGPFGGDTTLALGGESITLFKPHGGGEIRADRVIYDDDAPWSSLADGRGASLSRIDPTAYGNDVLNWASSIAGGTPGSSNETLSNVPQTFPYSQGFEAVDESSLAGWNLSVSGLAAWRVLAEGAPDGVAHLTANPTNPDASQQQATIVLDLAAQAGRTDLALDFSLRLSGDDPDATREARLEISGDGAAWTELAVLQPIVNHYTDYAFDLDVSLADAGIDLDESIYVRFQHDSWSSDQGFAIDNVRVSDIDFFAPNIVAQNPADIVGRPIDQLQVTFDDPIDAATFTSEDVILLSPTGASITPDSISSEDMLTWTIAFAPQTLLGTYRVTIGPSIADVAGNLMSQGGAAIDGLTTIHKPFVGEFEVGPPAAQAYPHTENFTAASIDELSSWRFATTGTATWEIEGNRLKADQVSAGDSTHEAVLVLDLASQSEATDLSLDFWVERRGRTSGNFGVLSVSGDGEQWSNVYGLSPALGEPTQFIFDLDQVLSETGVEVDEDVYLRFEHTGRFTNDEMFIDDVRIGNADLVGPHVTSISPSATVPRPVDTLEVTFSEPIDLATLGSEDINVRNSIGGTAALIGQPVDQGDGQTFAVSIAAQAIGGTYHVSVGPDVTDVAGNRMNQDGDPTNGEVNGNDTFQGSFTIGPPTAQAFPYSEGFESGSIAELSGWSFSVDEGGSWALSEPSDEAFGAYELKTEQSVNGLTRKDAILVMNLTDQTEVYLDFWGSTNNSYGFLNETRVLVSGDGNEWTWIGTIAPTNDEPRYYAFDLAEKLAEAEIVLDNDVYVMFSHTATQTTDTMVFDNVRVSDIDPFGPKIVSQTSLETVDEVSRFSVTFDEPVDPSSFTTDDVLITLPGAVLPITSVETADGVTFTITLPEPRLAGLYDVAIGPDIVGVDGIPMNQDEDSANGEPDEDAYIATIFVAATPVTLPHFQGFESGDLGTVEGWTFRAQGEFSWGGGDWRVIGTEDPYDGEYHLRATQHADCWTQHDAVLAIDTAGLMGNTDLVLDFYMQRLTGRNKSEGGRNMGKLFVSGDGSTWTQVGDASQLIDTSPELLTDLDRDGTLDLVPPLGEYLNYRFDFDAMLSAGGVELGGVIFLNVHRLGFYSDDVTTWDNIRIFTEGSEPAAADIVERSLLYRDTPFYGDLLDTNSRPSMPGEAFASTSVSNYGRGINGVVIEVASGVLPNAGSDVNPSDFRFRVADLDAPNAWSVAPNPSLITVVPTGAGTDRITISWPDDSIRYQHLQVTLLAGGDTGMAIDDVFYFVSVPGDGDQSGNIDQNDYDIWAAEKFTLADEQTRADFNRDGVVDGSDFNVLAAGSTGARPMRSARARVARTPRAPAADRAVSPAVIDLAWSRDSIAQESNTIVSPAAADAVNAADSADAIRPRRWLRAHDEATDRRTSGHLHTPTTWNESLVDDILESPQNWRAI